MVIPGYEFRELVLQDLRELGKWLQIESKAKTQEARIADVGETEVMLFLLKLTCNKNVSLDELAGVVKIKDLEELTRQIGVPFQTGAGSL